ncbi:MAG: surface-adhesin E family protein [Erythrobacter sp.]
MIALLLLISSPAVANLPCVGAKLCQIAAEDAGTIHYIDPTTVRPANGIEVQNMWQAWFTSDNSYVRNVAYRQVKSLEIFDCDRKMVALRTRVEYDEQKNVLDHRRYESLKFVDVIPDTIVEAKFEVMCPAS